MIEPDTWIKRNADQLGINENYINPASVDVTLGEHIIEYLPRWRRVLDEITFRLRRLPITRDDRQVGDYLQDGTGRQYVMPGRRDHYLKAGHAFTFRPGRFYLAHTNEYSAVPETHVALLFLKSSSGRKGFDQAHAGVGDPGFIGQWTFELYAHRPVTFREGDRIAQLLYFRLTDQPQISYARTGRYNGQLGATTASSRPMEVTQVTQQNPKTQPAPSRQPARPVSRPSSSGSSGDQTNYNFNYGFSSYSSDASSCDSGSSDSGSSSSSCGD